MLIWLLAAALGLSLAANLWLWRQRQTALPALPLAPNDDLAPSEPIADNYPLLFRSLVATLDAGVIVVDRQLRILLITPPAASILSAEPHEAIGNSLIALVRDYQADRLVGDVLNDGEPRETMLRPVASSKTIRLFCSPIVIGDERRGALILARDITQLSMLERSRRDLVANVSHELRTPLASLKLLTETLQFEPPASVAQRMLGQMAQEIDAVTQLVEELHELAQIEAGRISLKLSPTAPEALVARALDRIRPQAERKELQLIAEVGFSTMVLADADRIGQVLLNLLHNAVKFTTNGGTVTLQAALAQTDQLPQGHPAGDWALFSVRDTGIGIPAEDLPRIFERFYKVDRARTRNSGGTGLGLAIAKHLVEGHGGRLWVRSVEGQGSTFLFSLPLESA